MIAQMKNFNDDCVKISIPYLSYFSRNKSSKSVTVGSGLFIVLNDSARLKMFIKIYFIIYPISLKGFRAV